MKQENNRGSQKPTQAKSPGHRVGKSLNNHTEIFNPTKSHFSIDTLLLGIDQFTIHPINELIIERSKVTTAGEVLYNHPLFTTTNGESFSGQKATFKNGEFSVWIQSPDHLTLLFSPTRLVNGLNVFPISLGQFTRAIRDKVTRKLREIGVCVDISSAKIYRIDLFKDVFLERDVLLYSPIFELLPELNQRVRRREFYKTTFYAGNTQWELAMYDKVRELKHQLAKGRIKASRTLTELLSSNILRVELRLKNRDKVKNKLKFKVEGGSCTCDKFTHLQFIFPRLERFFNEELLSLLFKHEPSFTPSNRLDRLRAAIESSDKQRNKLNDALLKFAYSELGGEDPTAVREILERAEVSPTSIWLKMKEIKKARLSYRLSDTTKDAKSEESLEMLYRELKTKLVGG